MPPRYAYWTILIDNRPTAFRARDHAELLPTFNQLKRTNPNAEMKWFARGKLWDSPEQAQWANRNLPKPAERRARDWRPGGTHKDPRQRPKGSKRAPLKGPERPPPKGPERPLPKGPQRPPPRRPQRPPPRGPQRPPPRGPQRPPSKRGAAGSKGDRRNRG